MKKIFVLPETVSSKIAAGEVIERPASVIRELIDNSIDASSTEITVKIENAGIKKIIVSDNGDGIEKEDLELAFTKHATSKIHTIDDLLSLNSMGFRGEALHSIQTVSKTCILSNTDPTGLTTGFKISNFGDDSWKILSSPSKKGTKIEVSDIFYNLPVRKMFLKSATTEINSTKKVINDKALAFLNTSFRFYNDDKLIFMTKGDSDFKSAFFAINKTETRFDIFEHTETFNENLKIKVYYSQADVFFQNRKYQALYVNNRPVSAQFFYSALDTGVRNFVSPGRFPLFYFFVDINPNLIDINIHPAKKEIKFKDNGEIFLAVKQTASSALSKIFKREILQTPDFSYKIEMFDNTTKLFSEEDDKSLNFNYFEKIPDEKYITKEIGKKETQENDYQIHGVVFDTYIIVELDDKILLVDQHAAAEAIIFKRKKDNYLKSNSIEKLLIPALIEIEIWDTETENKLEILNKNGFLIEKGEGTTVIVREMPEILLLKKDYIVATDIISEFLETKNKIETDVIDYILIEASCREAIKKGDKLNFIEITEIIDEYLKLGITNCPHGRPIHFELSKDCLEKVFQRKK